MRVATAPLVNCVAWILYYRITAVNSQLSAFTLFMEVLNLDIYSKNNVKCL